MADGGFLPDFEPEEDEQELPRPQDKEKPKSYVEKRNFQKYFFCTMLRQQYSGVHISGFRDFLLKPELNRAIQDCGFEHPSEGALLKLELFQLSFGQCNISAFLKPSLDRTLFVRPNQAWAKQVWFS